MAEWFKAHAWKACVAKTHRGFESLSLRQLPFPDRSGHGRPVACVTVHFFDGVTSPVRQFYSLVSFRDSTDRCHKSKDQPVRLCPTRARCFGAESRKNPRFPRLRCRTQTFLGDADRVPYSSY